MPRVAISMPTELGVGAAGGSAAAEHREATVQDSDGTDEVPLIVRWHACWAAGAS